jgi:hypothetical protein
MEPMRAEREERERHDVTNIERGLASLLERGRRDGGIGGDERERREDLTLGKSVVKVS